MRKNIGAGRERMRLEDGRELRLLSALEVLQARPVSVIREAEELAQSEGERALCANACLLARALENHGRPVFDSGKAVLAAMGIREIGALAAKWAAFDREENPSPEDGRERALALKKAWSTRLMSAFAGACSGRSEPSPQRRGPRK